ncbi:unnamed protein product, partial [Ectocarpus sp. 12 AP-2014]
EERGEGHGNERDQDAGELHAHLPPQHHERVRDKYCNAMHRDGKDAYGPGAPAQPPNGRSRPGITRPDGPANLRRGARFEVHARDGLCARR